MLKVAILLCFLTLVQSQENIDLILDVSNHFLSKSVVIHKNLKNSLKLAKEVNILGKYVSIQENSGNCNLTNYENVDLQVTQIESNYTLSCLSSRKKTYKGPWLLFSGLNSINQVLNILKSAKLNFNDEVWVA